MALRILDMKREGIGTIAVDPVSTGLALEICD